MPPENPPEALMPKTSSPRRRRFPRSRLWRGCNGGEKLERLLRWPSLIRRCTPTVRIWSGEHGLYWRANAGGYTAIESEAGIYPIEDALRRTRHAGPEKLINFLFIRHA